MPNRHVPWRAIWPGALAATLAIGVVDYGFPLYLSTISTVGAFTTIFVFVLIVLIWFYLLAIIILGRRRAQRHALRAPRDRRAEPPRLALFARP